jgi:hypothetical protein
MNANYATNAGTADLAKSASSAAFATNAQEAVHAIDSDKAVEAQRATNATYAIVSKEAERLNLASNMIYISPESHMMIFMAPGQDPNKSIIFDLVNNTIFNVKQISDPSGNVYAIQAAG